MLQQFYRFFEAGQGYLGSAPKGTRNGDIVSVAKGCSGPLVLSREDNHYIIVGSYWIFGLMDGEAAKLHKKEEFQVGCIEIW
jgi:hypothetical protein